MSIEEITSVHINRRQIPTVYDVSGMDKLKQEVEKIFKYSDGLTVHRFSLEGFSLYNKKGQEETFHQSKIDITI